MVSALRLSLSGSSGNLRRLRRIRPVRSVLSYVKDRTRGQGSEPWYLVTIRCRSDNGLVTVYAEGLSAKVSVKDIHHVFGMLHPVLCRTNLAVQLRLSELSRVNAVPALQIPLARCSDYLSFSPARKTPKYFAVLRCRIREQPNVTAIKRDCCPPCVLRHRIPPLLPYRSDQR
jgi:hypothetical protein